MHLSSNATVVCYPMLTNEYDVDIDDEDIDDAKNMLNTLDMRLKQLTKEKNKVQNTYFTSLQRITDAQCELEKEKNRLQNICFGSFHHMTIRQCEKLQIGDNIDHRDATGRFLLAKILNITKNCIYIHYQGWSTKWDTWINYKNETNTIAYPRSISRKPNTRFSKAQFGDLIEIYPPKENGWKKGIITNLDKHSGQVEVQYIVNNEIHYYWGHLNDIKEIRKNDASN